MVKTPVATLLQVSDMHLQQEPEQTLRGFNVEQRFLKVLQQLKQEQSDLLLLTGDLSHHAPAAYDRLDGYLNELLFSSRWIPGNHDLVSEMDRFSHRGYADKQCDIANWRLLFLDSTDQPDGKGGGSLSNKELAFLQRALDQSAEVDHLMLVIHHHPCSVNSQWQDAIALGNAERFWQLIKPYRNVRAIMFGHVHQAWQLQHAGVQLFSVPATAPQFVAETVSSETETDPALAGPAYGRYELYSDGSVSQQVIRLPTV